MRATSLFATLPVGGGDLDTSVYSCDIGEEYFDEMVAGLDAAVKLVAANREGGACPNCSKAEAATGVETPFLTSSDSVLCILDTASNQIGQ